MSLFVRENRYGIGDGRIGLGVLPFAAMRSVAATGSPSTRLALQQALNPSQDLGPIDYNAGDFEPDPGATEETPMWMWGAAAAVVILGGALVVRKMRKR